jgi:hypothetical protein
MTQINEIVEGRLWIVRNAVPKTLCDHVALEYHMIKDVVQYQYPDLPMGDPTMPGAFSMYCPVPFEALGQYHKPLIEMLIKKKLWQTFSYGRLYVKNTECYAHRDRSSGEWVGNICVSADPQYKWPFFIEVKGKTYEFFLNTGDSIIFRGHEDLHWRPNYEGPKEQIQCFVSYVEQEGKFAKNKWDGRPMLAAPWEAAGEWIRNEQNNQNHNPYYGPCEQNTGEGIDEDDEALEELL